MGRSGGAIKTGAVKAGKGWGFTGERTQGGSPVARPRVSDQGSGTTSTARRKPWITDVDIKRFKLRYKLQKKTMY